MIFRLMSAGAVGWWVPASKVNHMISPERQSWNYIYDFAQAYGETLAYMEDAWPEAHHLASSRDRGRIRGSAVGLQLRGWLYRAASRVHRISGRRQRGAELLSVAGLFSGASRFSRRAAAGPG